MPERMAEIEQSPFAGLALVARDDSCLHATAFGDGVLARRATGEDLAPMPLQPLEESSVSHESVLGNLGITSAEFPLRQRIEEHSIADDEDRLVKCPDQIFSLSGVDGGLAAHRGVHLCAERPGNLDVIHPATDNCRSEPGEIADNPAAERDDEIAALDARLQ